VSQRTETAYKTEPLGESAQQSPSGDWGKINVKKIDSSIIGLKTEISIYTSLTPKPDALIRHFIGVHY